MDEIKNLTLICGDEEYLKNEKKKELLRALGTDGSPDFFMFDGSDADLSEISDLASAAPFFKNRTILLKDTGLFKGASDENFTKSLSDLPGTTYMIFVEQEADAREKLYKLIKSKGAVYRFMSVDSVKDWRTARDMKGDVAGWVRRYVNDAGLEIDGRALEALLELSGYGMDNLCTELEKLISFSEGLITKDHVEQICSKTVSDRVFDMVNLKLSGNTSEALRLFEDMLSVKTEPMRIIYMLAKQFNQVYLIKDLEQRKTGDAEILETLGIKDWQLKRLRERSRGRSLDDMRGLTELCVEMETKIKSGDIPDRIAAEVILCS